MSHVWCYFNSWLPVGVTEDTAPKHCEMQAVINELRTAGR